MKILFIGDICGRPGRETVTGILPSVLEEHKPDIVIANAENLSHGAGFLPEHITEMQKLGVNFFTTGNHVWAQREGVLKLNDRDYPVIRPANYPDNNTPGRGYEIIEDGMMNKVLIINLMGQVFMRTHLDSPFKTIDRILNETSHEQKSAIFVDFHAEATSEKYAMAYYLDGKVSCVVGTHTHVQTVDARVLENGTGYVTDVGMCGSFDSIIGVKKDIILKSFLTQMPVKHELETEGKMVFSAVLVEVDEKTKKAENVSTILKFL